MRCAEIRWRLSRFLEGTLCEQETTMVQAHLDVCPDCVEYLVKSGKVDRLNLGAPANLGNVVVDRVLLEVAVFDHGSALLRLLYYIFGAASLLAITVFAFVRYYLSPSALNGLGENLREGQAVSTFFPFLEGWVSSPAFSYVLLSLAAVLLSVGLIFVVDLAGQLFGDRNQPVRAGSQRS